MTEQRDDLDQWLLALPKVELHCHLEGSMSVATVRKLSERHNVDPTILWPDGLPEAFSFVDFPDFGLQYFYGLSLLRSAPDIAAAVDDLAETLAAQNVRYAELTTTAFTYFLDTEGLEVGRPPVSQEAYVEGLNEGRRLAAERAKRIGHGVRCLEDPAVVDLLGEHNVMLEVCPTSNLLLGVVDRLQDHPLPHLREAGLRVCLNTDDPGWFATDLVSELRIASDLLGVDRANHLAMQRDAVEASFAADDVKAALRAELDQVT